MHANAIRRLLSSAIAAALLSAPSAAFAQNPLHDAQYKSLRGLSELTLLVTPPDKPDTAVASTLGLDAKTIGDAMTIGFAMHASKLHVGNQTRADKPYLEVSWSGTAAAVSLSLSLWRLARVDDSNERTPVVVWERRRLLVAPTPEAIRSALDGFAAAFGADYERASR